MDKQELIDKGLSFLYLVEFGGYRAVVFAQMNENGFYVSEVISGELSQYKVGDTWEWHPDFTTNNTLLDWFEEEPLIMGLRATLDMLNNWKGSHITVPINFEKKCTCDFNSVILISGCKCGGT